MQGLSIFNRLSICSLLSWLLYLIFSVISGNSVVVFGSCSFLILAKYLPLNVEIGALREEGPVKLNDYSLSEFRLLYQATNLFLKAEVRNKCIHLVAWLVLAHWATQDIHCSVVLEMGVLLGIAKSPGHHSESGLMEALIGPRNRDHFSLFFLEILNISKIRISLPGASAEIVEGQYP